MPKGVPPIFHKIRAHIHFQQFVHHSLERNLVVLGPKFGEPRSRLGPLIVLAQQAR
jgi:hypothetical protein